MPPDSSGYLIAAYVVVAVSYVGYAIVLLRRAGKVKH